MTPELLCGFLGVLIVSYIPSCDGVNFFQAFHSYHAKCDLGTVSQIYLCRTQGKKQHKKVAVGRLTFWVVVMGASVLLGL